MRSYTVNTDPVKVSVNGITFELLKSDGVAQAEIMQYLADTANLAVSSPEDVRLVLRAGSELIDSLLGSGACYQIFGKTPISMGHILSLLSQIGSDCAAAYRQYLKNEYLEG